MNPFPPGDQGHSTAAILAKKRALRRLSYGVYVVSVRHGEVINAMTVRMVSQVSERPPRLAVSIAKRCYTHDLIQKSEAFAVHVLAQGQELLGGHFGLRTGRDVNKLAGVEFETGVTGAPILKECSAFLECRLSGAHDMGNCTLFIGEMVASGVSERPPLIYRESDYFG